MTSSAHGDGAAGWVDGAAARFQASRSWDEVLLPHGWRPVGDDDRERRYLRPGDPASASSAVVYLDTDRLTVYSEATAFGDTLCADGQRRTFDRLDAAAILDGYGPDPLGRVAYLQDHGFDPADGRVQPEAPAPGAGPVLVCLDTVEAEPVSWLWPGRIPLGKITLLDGDPGVGKSTLALDVAAHATTGTPWPDKTECPQGGVVLLSAEDGLADTVRPRLEAAGGDPTRVHALTGLRTLDKDGDPDERPLTLADVDAIKQAVLDCGAVLVVVDVLMAYLPDRIDAHKDQHVRKVLARLAAMAERTGGAVLLLRHLNKASGMPAMYRGGGSIGIIGASRAGILAATDPDDPDASVLAWTKSNLAPTPDSLRYRLVSSSNGASRIEWLGTSDHTADTLTWSPDKHHGHDEHNPVADVIVDYLHQHGGKAPALQVQQAVSDQFGDVSESRMTRARRKAAVTSSKDGYDGGWTWSLPEEAPKTSKKSAATHVTSSTPSSADETHVEPIQAEG